MYIERNCISERLECCHDDTLRVPFGSVADIALNSAGGLEQGFFNNNDQFTIDVTSGQVPTEEFQYSDAQKPAEYIHYSQLVDLTAQGSGNYVVFNAFRNQSTTSNDQWRWSELEGATTRWAVPLAVKIGHKIPGSTTIDGENIKEISLQTTSTNVKIIDTMRGEITNSFTVEPVAFLEVKGSK